MQSNSKIDRIGFDIADMQKAGLIPEREANYLFDRLEAIKSETVMGTNEKIDALGRDIADMQMAGLIPEKETNYLFDRLEAIRAEQNGYSSFGEERHNSYTR